nr:hypothetical protein RTCK_03938 [Rhizobium sp. TCK]
MPPRPNCQGQVIEAEACWIELHAFHDLQGPLRRDAKADQQDFGDQLPVDRLSDESKVRCPRYQRKRGAWCLVGNDQWPICRKQNIGDVAPQGQLVRLPRLLPRQRGDLPVRTRTPLLIVAAGNPRTLHHVGQDASRRDDQTLLQLHAEAPLKLTDRNADGEAG